ncbi:MAG: c-5 sterol desaturase [Caeruleum heppii]|nr:MAG: c-5 sterol desaturase [Caeruleum heppii]
MDVVLEVFDTFGFDRLWATLLPASSASDFVRSTLVDKTSTRELPTLYHYQPASQFLPLEPSEWAFRSALPRDNIIRQTISLYLISWLFGVVIYFVFASLSYLFIFDKATFAHPKFLKNQIRQEIRQTLHALPVMAIFTVPMFVAEVRGHSKLYDASAEGPGRWYDILQFPIFIMFTDCFVYWIHRGLHYPAIYKRLHKPHHKWIVPSPYASHAFHPLDGFSQGFPYHVFPFIFPLQKFAYITLFVFINIWTVFIHDGEYVANSPIINGAACHTMHHLYFNFNYGQFTTLWDRLGGSYRKPNPELFTKQTKMGDKEWQRQSEEMEKMVQEIEGVDDRSYGDGQAAEAKKVQ